MHVADHAQRGDLEDRVDEGRLGVRDQQHVAFLDLLVAPDARAVEPEPVGEHVVRQLPRGEREVLPDSRKVDESQIDDLNLGFFSELLHVVGRLRHDVPPSETSKQQTRGAWGQTRLPSHRSFNSEKQQKNPTAPAFRIRGIDPPVPRLLPYRSWINQVAAGDLHLAAPTHAGNPGNRRENAKVVWPKA